MHLPQFLYYKVTVCIMEKFLSDLNEYIKNGTFVKCVLSGFRSGDIKRITLRSVKNKEKSFIQAESHMKDGKALHENLEPSAVADHIRSHIPNIRQINLSCTQLEREALISKKGALHVTERKADNKLKSDSLDKRKNYYITSEPCLDFLVPLDIRDGSGRIRDKRQSKFRQINKFLEIIDSVRKRLPKDRVVIWDLCCGKSYLSFAAYYYFTEILKVRATVYGVDRKEDVTRLCGNIARELGWDMRFTAGDVFECLPEEKPDLVLSLHACDIATDIVLANAVKADAEVILSSPCCQHELSEQIKCKELGFILDEPILKQKFSAIATDALRCKLLSSCGYKVDTLEFIDPEETPKNLMIRAVKQSVSEEVKQKRYGEYKAASDMLGARLTMEGLLKK